MEPLAYLHLQMRLEGRAVVNACSVRQVEVVPDEELPLMLIAQLANQDLIVYYEEALSPDLQQELAACLSAIEFPRVDPILDILQSHNIQSDLGHYKTSIFPSRPAKDDEVICLLKHDSRVKAFGFDGFAERVYAIEQDGVLVSACVSTRENEKCGEAWVYTIPDYRNQGLAQKVVSAWARCLMAAGKVPFYSHQMENAASANLAGKLRLRAVFEEMTLTQR